MISSTKCGTIWEKVGKRQTQTDSQRPYITETIFTWALAFTHHFSQFDHRPGDFIHRVSGLIIRLSGLII